MNIQDRYERGEIAAWQPPTLSDTIDFQAVCRAAPTFSESAPGLMADTIVKTTCFWPITEEVLKENGIEWGPQYQQSGTCHPAGTLVSMADGSEKQIQDIVTGDLVVTHNSTPRRVTKVGVREYSGMITRLHVKGQLDPLLMTDDHPVLCADASGTQWVNACDLDGHSMPIVPRGYDCATPLTLDLANYVDAEDVVRVWKSPVIGEDFVRPKHTNLMIKRFVTVDEDLAWAFGLYLAEGNTEPRRVTYTLGIDEMPYATRVRDILHDKFGVLAKIKPEHGHSTIRVRLDSAAVSSVFQSLLPGLALTKCVPDFAFTIPVACRKAMLRGWVDGDGHIKASRTCITAVTSSAQLNRGMHRLAVSCGIKPTSQLRKQAAHQNAPATVLEFGSEAAVGLMPEIHRKTAGKSKTYTKHSLGFAVRVRDIARYYTESLPVYSLEVEHDHSYIVNGIAVHNCVGQGAATAVDDLQCLHVRQNGLKFEGRAAVAGTYAGGRVEAAGRPGRWEGSNCTWSAKYFLEVGILLKKHIPLPEDDLEEDERLAMKWTASKDGIPEQYEKLANGFGVSQATVCKTTEELAVALCNLCTAFQGSQYWASGKCDELGISPVRRQNGGHAQAFRGVIVEGGRRYFAQQNSWGKNWAPGYKGKYRVPPGCVLLSEGDAQLQLNANDTIILAGPKGFVKQTIDFRV